MMVMYITIMAIFDMDRIPFNSPLSKLKESAVSFRM
jgi:hypothetical protein